MEVEKLQISYPVIVEGKYDRLRLLSVIDANIYTTEGFGIFKKKEKLALFRALAAATPVIVLTDPDGAGTQIRSFLTGVIPKERLIPLYVPQIRGKDPRKKEPSAAGFLGVEGQERERLYRLFLPFAGGERPAPAQPITKADLYEDGLTGAANSAARRAALARQFDLPEDMTPNALLSALNIITDLPGYRAALAHIF